MNDANLVEQWVGHELIAEGVVDREDGQLIFHGNTSDYLIEIKAFNIGKRLTGL